ncbi:SRPBCC family protein [Micromonospora sp. NPDC003816]|uniref:SRPBCC family protein n=1 Tax=Micromonospora sp. NPDC003816 TaxID=3364224 RepID=UPI0036CC0EB9
MLVDVAAKESTTMTASTRETRIVADPTVPQVIITREFDAPPDAVFRAHTDPELFARWIGPRDIATVIDTWDCRSGGSYRYVQQAEGFEGGFRGCFHEVRPGELIVQTFTFEGMPDGVALERLSFEDLGGRTRLTATSLVDSFEDRDAFLASGMEVGVREGYEQLDGLLVERVA